MATNCCHVQPHLQWTEEDQLFSIVSILRAGVADEEIVSQIQNKQQ